MLGICPEKEKLALVKGADRMDAFTQEMQEKLLKERDELLRKLNSEEDNFRQEALASYTVRWKL